MKHGDRKEDERGWLEWHQPDPEWPGYWSRIEDENRTKDRVPIACPPCGALIDNWKAKYYHRWGVCNDCYYIHIHGQDLPELTSNEARRTYCVQKVAEKKGEK